jgi:large subunit ribosomal protein L4
MVRGGGAKPWRQKGTGRARAGSSRSPIWTGGGTVFGPQPRSYEYTLPKKVELGALRAALMAKLQENALVVVDALTAPAVKTKAAAATLKGLGVTGKALLIDSDINENFALSVRNLPGITLALSTRITARQVAITRKVIVTKSAIEKLEAALGA